ncbi:unnamed protein product [Ambrosiozyma monospora]|uniref:Unnamed protein product n=1 Tax=Ambrosiozyma monospora TaxID=43982 RepID=A0ACB5SRP3_AMBMO|nr:unnamed protein product [Ambrosiozyma monospora]
MKFEEPDIPFFPNLTKKLDIHLDAPCHGYLDIDLHKFTNLKSFPLITNWDEMKTLTKMVVKNFYYADCTDLFTNLPDSVDDFEFKIFENKSRPCWTFECPPRTKSTDTTESESDGGIIRHLYDPESNDMDVLDLTCLNFYRFSSISIFDAARPPHLTIIKLGDVSISLDEFSIGCLGTLTDHIRIEVPFITGNMRSCGLTKYYKAIKMLLSEPQRKRAKH